jgi:predicted GNAT family N-acyltransferase
MSSVEIKPITAQQARVIRGPILRPGYPPERTIFPGDDAPDTRHMGAFERGYLVGIATVLHQQPPELDTTDSTLWRLRGMATLTEVRGKGYGADLVRACLTYVATQRGSWLWCDARESARGFYEHLGFEVRGDRYVLPESGAHYRMWCALTSQDG